MNRQIGKQIDRHTDTQAYRHETRRHKDTLTHRQNETKTCRHTDTQTDGRMMERTAVLSPSLETQKNR